MEFSEQVMSDGNGYSLHSDGINLVGESGMYGGVALILRGKLESVGGISRLGKMLVPKI